MILDEIDQERKFDIAWDVFIKHSLPPRARDICKSHARTLYLNDFSITEIVEMIIKAIKEGHIKFDGENNEHQKRDRT